MHCRVPRTFPASVSRVTETPEESGDFKKDLQSSSTAKEGYMCFVSIVPLILPLLHNCPVIKVIY